MRAGGRDRRTGGFASSPAQAMFVAVDNSTGPRVAMCMSVTILNMVRETGPRSSPPPATSSPGWGKAARSTGRAERAGSGPFGPIEGIAVDPTGNLWVATSTVTFEQN